MRVVWTLLKNYASMTMWLSYNDRLL